jgi:hypothetical protein
VYERMGWERWFVIESGKGGERGKHEISSAARVVLVPRPKELDGQQSNADAGGDGDRVKCCSGRSWIIYFGMSQTRCVNGRRSVRRRRSKVY